MRLMRVKLSESNVDLTPMIDVVLLLVVFFMLTTQFARTQQVPLELPHQPGERAEQTRRPSMIIDLSADGRLSTMGSAVDMETLLRDIELERGVAGANLEIVVRADRTASAAHLNALADTLVRAGVRHWQLATATDGNPGQGQTGGAP